MSQITRCPNCSTTFRVSDAQLAAFQGKVRCGKCAFIFFAPDNLVLPEIPAMPSASVLPEIPAVPPDADPIAPQIVATDIAETPSPVIETAAEDEGVVVEVPAMTFAAAPPLPAQDPAEHREERRDDYRPIPLDEDEFLPQRQPDSKWWLIPVSLMIALLLLQIVYAARTRITMELPGLRPQFVAACKVLGCNVPLPRRSELLRSEWSELSYVPGHPNLIQLSATLRNLAPFAQALPLLQLSLTDEQGNIVARRIFRPETYLVATERGRSQLAAGDELHAYLQLDLGELGSTGYSLFWIHE